MPAALALFMALCPASPASAAPRVAVLSPENRSPDPRYDYIAGIVQGIFLYDLSSSGLVELVDRAAIDALLRERELSLSAIAAAPTGVFTGIASADWIVVGEYVLLGTELRLTLKLIEVSSSRVATFSDTGSTENLVHGLAEGVIERLTGKRPVLRDDSRNRSILSLRDETPGSISLFSPLIDAQVILDGTFAGYTTGDRRKPFVIEGVEPGIHEISTDLGRDFGVVKMPEVKFGPWKELVRVQSGKRAIVTDLSSHFNDQLYRLRRVFQKSPAVAFDSSGRYGYEYAFSFTDREGVERRGRLAIELGAPTGDEGRGSGTLACSFEGEARSESFAYSLGNAAELAVTIGLATFSAEVENSYGRVSVDLEVERTDVEQGMHRAGY
ncbi:MAG: hypothetical protein CVV51_04110 [Spirochaetae bacterium HGW-Spirochaetae-7]|nr:MAG: hypothetical protein CVV51_04110 [Spirochaetae bacterium HGW-Spirochaetae-7]